MSGQKPRCCDALCQDEPAVVMNVRGIPVVYACSLRHMAPMMRPTVHLGAERVLQTVEEFEAAKP